jgi:predicted NAD-dependent protein-ADP-ribosyltransferase YbiA (DUF1768 family)
MAETEERKIGAPVAAEVPAEVAPIEVPKGVIPPMPYDKVRLAAMAKFFTLRKKSPGQYRFNAEGNLEVSEAVGKIKSKMPPGVIQLARFLPLEPSEREAIEEARMAALTEMDAKYEEENAILQQAWEEYRTTGAMRAVLASNQRMTELDARRSSIRAAVRNVVSIDNPTVKDIILSDRYEERKMFGNKDPFDKEIARLCLYTFAPEVDQGKYVMDDAVEIKPKSEDTVVDDILATQRLKDGRAARIFYDMDSDANGFLSPMWVVDFTMNVGTDMRFSSAIQAYEYERAKELGNAPLAESLLKTRSPRTIRLLTRKVQGNPADVRGLWMKIYTAIYEQHPNLKARLLDTGSDTLVFADIRQGPSGIGLADKDPAALDPAKWKGENIVGVAQETIRTRMREGTEDEAAAAVVPAVGGSMTEEDQKKGKVAAIIHARRMARGH